MSGASKSKERYYFLKEHGICTKCGCADAAPNRTYCADCLYKQSEYRAKQRNAMTAEEKKRDAEWKREHRKKLVSQGLCSECGKPQCKYSQSRCYEHWLANKRRYREYYCREKAKKPVVERVYKAPAPRAQGENHPWHESNKFIFRKKV